ncbi:MAG: hypothetical protein H0T79_24560 [Deltaproteobacteria bacterium]|nr:hypothetical protein [Deltaproteobacteria bacterium]
MSKIPAILVGLALATAAACGDDDPSIAKDAAVVVSDAPSGPDASCFTITDPNPTHEQIINACTSAQKIFKTPTLPLLEADGSLPPLPQ